MARASSLMLSASTKVTFSVILETLPNFGPSSNQQSVTGAGLRDRPIKLCSDLLDVSFKNHFGIIFCGEFKEKKVFKFLYCGWSSGTPTCCFLPHNSLGKVKSKPGKTTAPLGNLTIP